MEPIQGIGMFLIGMIATVVVMYIIIRAHENEAKKNNDDRT
jgi:hypothetical protein